MVVPVLLTGQLDAQLGALGDVVQYRTYPRASHDSLLRAAYPLLAAWLHGRLLGRPAPQTCRLSRRLAAERRLINPRSPGNAALRRFPSR